MVRPAPIRGVVVQLFPGINGNRRLLQMKEIHVGLQDQEIPGDTGHPLERGLGILHVVEDAEEKNHIKCADPLRRKVEHLDLAVLDPGIENLPGEVEAVLAAPTFPAPTIGIDGKNSTRTTPLRLERKEAVPRSNIEDRSAGEL
jgi:hypothetical protein